MCNYEKILYLFLYLSPQPLLKWIHTLFETFYLMAINKGMDKEDVVHIYNGILLSHKKEQDNAICSNMDGRRDCHTE